MNRTIWTIVIATACLLSGCASPRDPLAARKRAYKRLLSFIEPGMTRRQLYALLPPRRTSIVVQPGMFTLPPSPPSERHELDPYFSLIVRYQLANPREYPAFRFDVLKGKSLISNEAIEGLLFGPPPKPVKSRENPNDQIVDRPVLVGPRRHQAAGR